MGVALYRKYRSRKLSEVVGQEHVTTLLDNALKSGRLAHAYLFTGPRGVGKTSIARILAHEINGLPYDEESTHLDIVEIDAASNNGVEDIRDLRDRVQIAPVNARKKIYIVDEVHMLSKAAFNALLKTLEEPPEHVVFILATTDIDKVPETIISRTQRHTFRRASISDIVKNLQRIAKSEGVTADSAALELIAKHADGSFRDSVSLFDQLLSGSDSKTVSTEHVTQSLGLLTDDTISELIKGAEQGDITGIDAKLRDLEQRGVPARTIAMQLADYLRLHLHIHPQYPQLLDSLLDVGKSHYPELKLLTVLSLFAQPTIQPSEPSAPTKPVRTMQTSVSPKPTVVKEKIEQAPTVPTKEVTSTQADDEPVKKPNKKVAATAPSEFDWDKLISHVRTHHVALHSVLCKCEPEIDGTTLILYTKSSFYKKKLDDPKYRGLLGSSLDELGFELDIETIASQKPLKDGQAAKVAAIMGGGEEVSVDDA